MKVKKKNYFRTTCIAISFTLFHMTAGSAVLTAVPVCYESGLVWCGSVCWSE